MAQLPKGEPAPADGRIAKQFDSSDTSFHTYVHVPYCLTRCGYCDFNTYTASELGNHRRDEYFEVVQKEIAFSEKVLAESEVAVPSISTVFFGGGTPTLLAAKDLISILDTLRSEFGLDGSAEITTEANPDSVDEDYLRELYLAGFNRISFGMQSAVPKVLKVLERTHNPGNVAKNVALAKNIGFQVSVDLIYGTPGETIADWRESLQTAIDLETDHISAYSLIVEPGTKLHRQISSAEIASPDEDLHAAMYEVAEQMLSDAGFSNYEVSNWAKDTSSRSRHNIAYWQSKNWWGYGPGAHSHIAGTRFWNVKHPAAYAERIAQGISPALEREIVDLENRNIEKVMLELRLAEGMDLEWLKANDFASAKVVSELIADGLIDGVLAVSGRLVLTAKGRLLADAVIRKVLNF
ncbi:MAG: hypothetical protein RLZZ556_118 [Actinomycetota bacterium]